MKIKRLLAVLLAGVSLFAQEEKPTPKPAPAPDVHRIFTIRHADVAQLAQLLSIFGILIQPQPGIRVIGVRGPQSVVDAVEQAIQRLDVPPAAKKNVELVFHMLMASTEKAAGGSVPSELEGVAKQLRSIFGYQSLRLIDTALVRARDGSKSETNGVLSGLAEEGLPPSQFFLKVTPSIVPEGQHPSLRLNEVRVQIRIPRKTGANATPQFQNATPQFQYVDYGIATDLDAREGQKVVIGKANLDSGEGQFIVVVTGKVVE